MNKFRVIEVIDSHKVKVLPRWEIKKDEGGIVEGNTVIIDSLRNIPNNDYLKQRLITLLSQKEVELYNPNLSGPPEIIDGAATCVLYLNNTEISYYFPEYTTANFS